MPYYDKSSKVGKMSYPDESMGTSSKLDACSTPNKPIGYAPTEATYPMDTPAPQNMSAQAGHTGQGSTSHNSSHSSY